MSTQRRRLVAPASKARRRWIAFAAAAIPLAFSCARYEAWRERVEDGPPTGSASAKTSGSVALSVAIAQVKLEASVAAASEVHHRYLSMPNVAAALVAVDGGVVLVVADYDPTRDRTTLRATRGNEDTLALSDRAIGIVRGRALSIRARARDGEIVVAWIASVRTDEQKIRIGASAALDKRSVGAMRVRYDLSEVQPPIELEEHWVTLASLVPGDVRIALAKATGTGQHPRAVVVATSGEATVPPAPSTMTVALPTMGDAGPPIITRVEKTRSIRAWLLGDSTTTPTPLTERIIALEPLPAEATSLVGPAIVGGQVDFGVTSSRLGAGGKDATTTAPIARFLHGSLGATAIEGATATDLDLALPAGAYMISTGDAVATFIRRPAMTREGELPDDPALYVRVVRADGSLVTPSASSTPPGALSGFVPVLEHPTECLDNAPVVTVKWAGGGLKIDPSAPDGDHVLPTLNAATYLERVWTGRLVVWTQGGIGRMVCSIDGLVSPKGTF